VKPDFPASRILIVLVLALLFASVSSSAQDWARAKVEKSPRHQEWITLKHGDRSVQAYIAYPESKKKTPAIVIIHEIFGMTDWVQDMADQLAAAGYIAIAPDLLSGMGPNGGRTNSFETQTMVREAISKLPPDQVTADLNAAADYVKKLPASNGKVSVTGFCWGGTQTFRYATNRPDLSAAYVFYGTGPDDVTSIKAPVYGFYAGNDARVDATIPKTEEAMKAAKKKYEPVTYEGAGHGFMRAGEDPEGTPENKKAHDDAWKRWLELLKK